LEASLALPFPLSVTGTVTFYQETQAESSTGLHKKYRSFIFRLLIKLWLLWRKAIYDVDLANDWWFI